MKNIIMNCSTLNTKGGMVSVAKNYLEYEKWGEYKITYVPTHFDTNKYILILYFALRYIQILFLLITRHYDIAHLHTAERGSFWRKRFLMKTYHKFGVKVVLHHHAAEFEEFYDKCSALEMEKVRETLAEADVNIVLSKRLVPMLKDKEPRAKVEVLYNAVKTYESNPYSIGSRNVLFLGRLGQRKGVFDLLEVIKRLDQKIPADVKFYLCGDRGETEVLAKVKEYNIEHRIAHIGWIDGQQKQEFISKSMINCLPSYNEGLPMTILETMAAGVPNISTNIASIPEVINHGDNGFMVKPGDVDSLTTFLLQLIENDEMRKRMSDASYNLIKNKFSIDNNITLLKSIYNSFSVK